MTRFLPAYLVLLAACDASLMLPSGVSCQRASQCETGLVCSFNQCVVSPENALSLQARITPPPTSGLLPQHLPALDLSAGPDLLVNLLPPVTLRGLVRHEGESDDIAGTLELRASGDIDGLDFSFTTTTLDGLDRDGFGYALPVLPGRAYTGTFRPSAPDLPRHIFTVTAEEVSTGRYDVTLPASSSYRRVMGRVMRSDYTPISEARVILLTSARDVAGVAITDDMRGFFEVLLPPTIETLYVKVESPSDGPVFPEFTTGPLPAPSESGLDLVVPDLPPGTEPIEATLEVLEPPPSVTIEGVPLPELVPASGRAVTIIGAFPDGTLRRSGTTDEAGRVTFRALPGAYEALIVSPPQSPAASWHGFINLGDPKEDASSSIALKLRVPVRGTVRDAFGLPVDSGIVTLTRRPDWGDGWTLAIAPPPFETRIIDGVFEAFVDPGTYDLSVAPDLGTGAPNAIETGLEVSAEGLLHDLDLPPPGLLHLTVASPEGTWLPDTRVELYSTAPLGPPRLIALGTTGPQGFVDILIPHEPLRSP
jgi:hypothetical protein